MHDITITTKPRYDGKITQEISGGFAKLAHQTTQWVMNTREDGMRQALMALGWVPPDEIAVECAILPSAAPLPRSLDEVKTKLAEIKPKTGGYWGEFMDGKEQALEWVLGLSEDL